MFSQCDGDSGLSELLHFNQLKTERQLILITKNWSLASVELLYVDTGLQETFKTEIIIQSCRRVIVFRVEIHYISLWRRSFCRLLKLSNRTNTPYVPLRRKRAGDHSPVYFCASTLFLLCTPTRVSSLWKALLYFICDASHPRSVCSSPLMSLP